jgi:hypothetical protein
MLIPSASVHSNCYSAIEKDKFCRVVNAASLIFGSSGVLIPSTLVYSNRYRAIERVCF